MSRTLRRPMFRGGGKIESRGTGITSGLDDRPGYAEAGLVDMDRLKSESEALTNLQKEMGIFSGPEEPATTFGLTRPELLNLAARSFEFASKGGDETFGQKLAGSASDALGDISTSMQARKEKFREQQREQDLIKAGNIQSVYEQLGEEAQIAKKVKSGGDYEIGFKLSQLKMDYEKDLEKFKDNTEKLIEIKQKYQDDRNKLITGTKDDKIVAKAILGDTEFVKKLKRDAKEELKKKAASNMSDKEFDDYVINKLDVEAERLWLTRLAEYAVMDPRDFLEQEFSKGGRVGLQMGGMSNQQPQPVSSVATNETGISYDEVRARLPKEIGDDIVQLVVSSPMALEDFASIQTQLDVDNFNSKYNVNLVLPQQEG
jgi:hypothetical protein